MQLPSWMYSQIITDKSTKSVWCFCGAPAISYCNGSQFVCDGGGHFGMPMVTLKPRPEYQKQLESVCNDALARARGDALRTKRRR